jgi:hypothetical protein
MNTTHQLEKSLDEVNTFGVYRLDIYHAPGWFLMNTYADERDADIYCDMLNSDTNMIHRVFINEKDDNNDKSCPQ